MRTGYCPLRQSICTRLKARVSILQAILRCASRSWFVCTEGMEMCQKRRRRRACKSRVLAGTPARQVQEVTGEHVEPSFEDQEDTEESAVAPTDSMVSKWRSSNMPRPDAASSHCRCAESSNAASPGPRVSTDRSETVDIWQRPWPHFISEPSPASCSPTSSAYWPEVNNTL